MLSSCSGNSNKISERFQLPTFPQLPENVCQIGCRRRRSRRTAQAFHGHGQIEYTDLGRPFVAAPNEKRSERDCVPQLLVRLGIICMYVCMLICVIASAAKVFGYLFNESETHAATGRERAEQERKGRAGSRPSLASYRAAKIKSLALGLVVTEATLSSAPCSLPAPPRCLLLICICCAIN